MQVRTRNRFNLFEGDSKSEPPEQTVPGFRVLLFSRRAARSGSSTDARSSPPIAFEAESGTQRGRALPISTSANRFRPAGRRRASSWRRVVQGSPKPQQPQPQQHQHFQKEGGGGVWVLRFGLFGFRKFCQNMETLKLAKVGLAKVSLAKFGHDRGITLTFKCTMGKPKFGTKPARSAFASKICGGDAGLDPCHHSLKVLRRVREDPNVHHGNQTGQFVAKNHRNAGTSARSLKRCEKHSSKCHRGRQWSQSCAQGRTMTTTTQFEPKHGWQKLAARACHEDEWQESLAQFDESRTGVVEIIIRIFPFTNKEKETCVLRAVN